MTTNRDRQRAAARARLEREMSHRAEQSRVRRRRNTTIAAGAGALIVLLAAAWVVIAVTSDGDKKNQAAADPSATPTPTSCSFLPMAHPSTSASPDPETAKYTKDVGLPPATGEARTGTQTMTLDTSAGTIKIQVDTAHAPCAAESFTYLASKKFFDNSICHRLVLQQVYVLQCGDPSGTGYGGPSYRYAEENLPTDKRPAYAEGVVAMANNGQPASTGSQFFIVYKDIEDSAQLKPNYTVIGRVTEGLDLVKKIAAAGVQPEPSAEPSAPASEGKPKTEVKINSLTMSTPQP
ncbi:peptidylprolyl isomerase [Dactylosporangium sp. NPDC051485]|uniref:peptidylprolyl isomerase n=1 Tax=Dactylosporangium sp. NPDC051485 TaxID=3154846 RepID=UPI003448AEB0